MQLSKKPEVVEEWIGQELFLYEKNSDRVHCLNSGAASIWYLCDGTRDERAIAEELATTFDLSKQQALADTQHIVAQFQIKGLVDFIKE